MIVEGIVTTTDGAGRTNIAPMGPWVGEPSGGEFEALELRPFETSRTYANLKERGAGVFHVTDDVLLLARATLGLADAATVALVPCARIEGFRLADCCRFHEFQVEDWDQIGPRARLRARIVHSGGLRDFLGFNRAKFAVVEAAIAASRIGILDIEQIRDQFRRLAPLIEKTGGSAEVQAFGLLLDHVERAASVGRGPTGLQ